MKNFSIQKNKGFTLVEMLVSIGLFSVVLVITLGSILTIVDVNRKSQSLTIVMNDLNFVLENITRSVKTGALDVNASLNDGNLHVAEDLGGGTREVIYKFNPESHSIQRSLDDGLTYVDMTSAQISVDKMNFKIFGTVTDSRQPRVLISISGTVSTSAKISSKFNIQTTVSQRNLDLDNLSL